MAKKAYTLSDIEGRTWLVKAGDPAFGLLASLKHPAPCLPHRVIMRGFADDLDTLQAEVAVRRSASAAEVMPEDDEVQALLIRAVSARDCLGQIGNQIIAGPKETQPQ